MFDEDLHWDYLCKQAIKGCSTRIVSICYESSLPLHRCYMWTVVLSTGNLPFVRFYDTLTRTKPDSLDRYFAWLDLEEHGTRTAEDMIEYLWNEQIADGGLDEFEDILGRESKSDRNTVLTSFNRRKGMYLEST